MTSLTRVACCGSFDGEIHLGHIHFLRSAKLCGTLLDVFVVSDEIIFRNKNRVPFYAQKDRVLHLKKLDIANRVIPLIGNDEENILQIMNTQPHIYCFGEDQRDRFAVTLQKMLTLQGTKIVSINRYKPKVYSTTKQLQQLKRTAY